MFAAPANASLSGRGEQRESRTAAAGSWAAALVTRVCRFLVGNGGRCGHDAQSLDDPIDTDEESR